MAKKDLVLKTDLQKDALSIVIEGSLKPIHIDHDRDNCMGGCNIVKRRFRQAKKLFMQKVNALYWIRPIIERSRHITIVIGTKHRLSDREMRTIEECMIRMVFGANTMPAITIYPKKVSKKEKEFIHLIV